MIARRCKTGVAITIQVLPGGSAQQKLVELVESNAIYLGIWKAVAHMLVRK